MNSTRWALFDERYWNKAPAHLRASLEDSSPIDGQRAFDTMVEAAAPFRAGTRFRALPDVRFVTARGRMRAPGDLLPDGSDKTVQHYAKRLEGRIGVGHRLVVEQPLLLDFALWSQVRDLVEPLWSQVGLPVLPVETELIAGHGRLDDDPPARAATHAALTWILAGSARMQLRPDHGDKPWNDPGEAFGCSAGPQEIYAEAGDLVYRPVAYRCEESFPEPALLLRLWVPIDRRLPVRAVMNLLADLVDRRRNAEPCAPAAGTVPYLPFPPPQGPDAATAAIPLLAETGQMFRAVADDGRLVRYLRVMWAKRASAGGLEPVPGPGTRELAPSARRVRASARFFSLPDEDGPSIWAVNGHAFRARGDAADRMLRSLQEGETVTVDEACGGQTTAAAEAQALLQKLYALSAIAMVPQELPEE